MMYFYYKLLILYSFLTAEILYSYILI